MLPFLKPKSASVAGLIIKNRSPDEKPEENQEDSSEMAIQECAQQLIDAVHSKNVQQVAEALKDAFELLDSMPHKEGPHIENNENPEDEI